MKFVTPENLDLESLLHYFYKPDFKYSIDQFKYIIHLLLTRSQTIKDYISTDYIPLHSKLLQKYDRNYNKVLEHLIHMGVIESDNQYIVGQKATGFRLAQKYQTPIDYTDVISWTFKKNLKIREKELNRGVKEYDYLNKWFNDKLQIDEKLIKDFLKWEYQLKKGNKNLWDIDHKTNKPKKPINQYNHAIINLNNFLSGSWKLHRDDNVFRYHTVLTNMRSINRNALTYDGQKLIGIDIKNSQPYISTILLSNLFWVIETTKDSISFSRQKKALFDPSAIKSIDLYGESGYIRINKDRLSLNDIKTKVDAPFIMLVESLQSLNNTGFDKYIDLVVEGKLYEYLEKEFGKRLGLSFSDRKAVKAAVFQVLFTSNKFIGQKAAKPKKVFVELFPEVYEVFKTIKKKDKTILPRLLQSIESYLIIDIISKRISKELPNAPIYTIHDSITTTEQYVDRVEQIMYEELYGAIGYPPSLKREEYDPQNIYNYMDKLKDKAKANKVYQLEEPVTEYGKADSAS